MYNKLLNSILETMKNSNYTLVELETTTAINKRKAGKFFSLDEHIEGLIWSLLSNQRPWKGISDNRNNIIKIFHNFECKYIQKENPETFITELIKIKCGNRAIKKQMYSLKHNIEIFQNIIKEYGSMDNFVTSDAPYNIAKKISSGKYKLQQIGFPLAMEYLRNVGIDTVKPDVHICRILGKERLALSKYDVAKEQEAADIIKDIADKVGLTASEVDYIFWQFCANGYAEICTKKPKCEICKAKKYCQYKK